MLGVEQVDGLDVTEDGGHHVLTEHVLGPVLSVYPEVKYLHNIQNSSLSSNNKIVH